MRVKLRQFARKCYTRQYNSTFTHIWQFLAGSGTDAKKMPRSAPTGPPDGRGRGDKYWQGARQRWNFKLLGQSLTETMSQWLTSDKKPVYVEQFIPPRSTLMEYFISKVRLVYYGLREKYFSRVHLSHQNNFKKSASAVVRFVNLKRQRLF